MKIRVFRLENSEGVGVYWSDLNRSAGISGDSTPAHPLPHYDQAFMASLQNYKKTNSEYDEDHFRFCFSSMTQLQRWFDSDACKRLASVGVKLNEYECDDSDMICGDTQCTFIKNSAKFIRRHDLGAL